MSAKPSAKNWVSSEIIKCKKLQFSVNHDNHTICLTIFLNVIYGYTLQGEPSYTFTDWHCEKRGLGAKFWVSHHLTGCGAQVSVA